MRLTVLMRNNPFVVPMIKPAMPNTISAIRKPVGTLQHAAALHAPRNLLSSKTAVRTAASRQADTPMLQ